MVKKAFDWTLQCRTRRETVGFQLDITACDKFSAFVRLENPVEFVREGAARERGEGSAVCEEATKIGSMS